MSPVRRRSAGISPLAGHAGLLFLVLVGMWAVLRPSVIFHADEGAALAQERLLDRWGSWTAPNPQPELDPEMEALSLELADRFDSQRWAPYMKHPLYPALLRAASWMTGGFGPILLSVLGTVAAALAAAFLANRLQPGSGVTALWVTGIGTPLLFDSYLVQAHTVGAAFMGWAAVFLCRSLDASGRSRLGLVLATCLLVTAATWVRTEALLAGMALGAAAAVAGRFERQSIATGFLVGAVAVAAWRLERTLLIEPLAGHGIGVIQSGREVIEQGTGQLETFRVTWLDSDYRRSVSALVFGTTGVMAAWCAAVLGRRQPAALRVAAAVTAVAYLLRASVRGLVPGLLIACPALAGVAALPRTFARGRTAMTLLIGWLGFSFAVAATQYSNGGGANWGGRFFALGLPLIVPIAVVGWRAAVSAIGPEIRRALTVCSIATVGALVLLAGTSMRDERNAVQSLVDAILTAREPDPSTDTALPVLATTGIATRFAWEHTDDGVWLTVQPDAARRYGERLTAEADHIVLVSFELRLDVEQLDEWWSLDREVAPAVAILRRR